MKRGTPSHPKTLALARALEVDVAQAMGILEMLCSHFAPAYCPQGDIGKWSDEEIAEGLQTTLPAERLIPALVRTRWLDTHVKHRLVIHDWAEHADNGVRERLKYQGLAFVSRRPPRVPRGYPEGDPRSPRPGTGTGTGSGTGSSPSDLLPESGSGARRVPKRTARARMALPADLVLTDDLAAYGKQRGCRNPGLAFAHFQNDASANGRLHRDWRAAVRKWFDNHGTFGCPCQAPVAPNGDSPPRGKMPADVKAMRQRYGLDPPDRAG